MMRIKRQPFKTMALAYFSFSWVVLAIINFCGTIIVNKPISSINILITSLFPNLEVHKLSSIGKKSAKWSANWAVRYTIKKKWLAFANFISTE